MHIYMYINASKNASKKVYSWNTWNIYVTWKTSKVKKKCKRNKIRVLLNVTERTTLSEAEKGFPTPTLFSKNKLFRLWNHTEANRSVMKKPKWEISDCRLQLAVILRFVQQWNEKEKCLVRYIP